MKKRVKRKASTVSNHLHPKQRVILLVIGVIVVLLVMLVVSTYAVLIRNGSVPFFQPVTPTNLPTVVPFQTSTPTPFIPTKISVPTKPIIRSAPTSAVTPTPGELGFHVPDDAIATVKSGECAKAVTITSKTSTAFHLGSMKDPSQPKSYWNWVRWQNPDVIMVEKDTYSDQYICVDREVPACGGVGGCSYITFYDNTTGATKNMRVCLTIPC